MGFRKFSRRAWAYLTGSTTAPPPPARNEPTVQRPAQNRDDDAHGSKPTEAPSGSGQKSPVETVLEGPARTRPLLMSPIVPPGVPPEDLQKLAELGRALDKNATWMIALDDPEVLPNASPQVQQQTDTDRHVQWWRERVSQLTPESTGRPLSVARVRFSTAPGVDSPPSLPPLEMSLSSPPPAADQARPSLPVQPGFTMTYRMLDGLRRNIKETMEKMYSTSLLSRQLDPVHDRFRGDVDAASEAFKQMQMSMFNDRAQLQRVLDSLPRPPPSF